MSEFLTAIAFYKWLNETALGDTHGIASLLFTTLMQNPAPDNEVWKLLEATGHKQYSDASFFEAAQIVKQKLSEVA